MLNRLNSHTHKRNDEDIKHTTHTTLNVRWIDRWIDMMPVFDHDVLSKLISLRFLRQLPIFFIKSIILIDSSKALIDAVIVQVYVSGTHREDIIERK